MIYLLYELRILYTFINEKKRSLFYYYFSKQYRNLLLTLKN